MNLKQTFGILIFFLASWICDAQIMVGAENYPAYASAIKGKKIGLVVNHTSFIGDEHLLDYLIGKNNTVAKIYAPEHGFRGKADAGEHIDHSIDKKTGIPIISLHGKNKKPSPEQLKGIDVMIFDIQDVGVRFYTYISTMHYVMDACAASEIPVIILDRPNPNGHYVDGPILNLKHQSFIGMHRIPIVHGLTIGELAKMINNEGWLTNESKCNLKVIPCKNYTHKSFYKLPIAPSPNLPNMKSIYLYPSICLLEGTAISVGRGTTKQFQIIGHPSFKNTYKFEFTPNPNDGSKHPRYENKICFGIDLSLKSEKDLQNERFTLDYLTSMYKSFEQKDLFFNTNNFFYKLSGNDILKKQIQSNISEGKIKESWSNELNTYKQMRKKYLLYSDFE